MAKTFTITSAHNKSVAVVDPDGYEVRFDGAGVATIDDEHAAAYFASVARFGYTVTPEPTPLAALPPRAPVVHVPPPPPAQPPKIGQTTADLGMDFEPEPEGQIPSAAVVVSPKDSPLVPEVAAAALRERYPDASDRIAIVRGLVTAEEFIGGVVATMEPSSKLRMHADLFPDAVARLGELERMNNEGAASLEAARAKLTGMADRIAELESALAAKDTDTAGPKARRK